MRSSGSADTIYRVGDEADCRACGHRIRLATNGLWGQRHRALGRAEAGAVMRDVLSEALASPRRTLLDALALVLLTAALCALGVMAWAAIGGPA